MKNKSRSIIKICLSFIKDTIFIYLTNMMQSCIQQCEQIGRTKIVFAKILVFHAEDNAPESQLLSVRKERE